MVQGGHIVPIQSGFGPDEIVNTKFKEPIMDFFIVPIRKQSNETLNLFISNSLRITSRRADVLNVSKPFHMNHPSRQERPNTQFIVVSDVDFRRMTATRKVGIPSPSPSMIRHTNNVTNRF